MNEKVAWNKLINKLYLNPFFIVKRRCSIGRYFVDVLCLEM